MDAALGSEPRTYLIKRNIHLGYGFVAGNEFPTGVKLIVQNGPSYRRLLPGVVIMSVNGIDVETAPRDQIIKMIQLCDDQIEIKVRQPSYEELIRAKNLTDTKFYTLNKSSQDPYRPANLNRLVTSISQQHAQQQQQQHLNGANRLHQRRISSSHTPTNLDPTPPVQIKPAVLRQQANNGTETDCDRKDKMQNFNLPSNKNSTHANYGRHSPLPQRCKSSMEDNGIGNPDKKSNAEQQPLLKRSNTMRPIKKKQTIFKPPPEVMEIFEVVIKVFFEDGGTKLLRYNQDTTVGTILETLNTRLTQDSPNSQRIKGYFGLALTVENESTQRGPNPKERSSKRKLLHILDDNDSIMKIRRLPYAPRLRLLYRMVYPPTDISSLYTQDKVAFDYLYQQSCNDLKLEGFSPELDCDTALKLSALHLLEYVHTNFFKAHGNSRDPKVYINLVKKSPGFEFFVPPSLVDKKGKKVKLKTRLLEQLRDNFVEFDFEPPSVKSTTSLKRYSSTSFHELRLPEMRTSPSDYIKLLFLNYLSQLPCYGSSKRPIRMSSSPTGVNSIGDCSSSLESVPRTSDSSPLIRQDKSQNGHCNIGQNERSPTISRLAQMNSVRSLGSTQSSNINSMPIDQPDVAQTPSIESISSITFNSPSPQQTFQINQSQLTAESYSIASTTGLNNEPSPMPRQQSVVTSRMHQENINQNFYNQECVTQHKHIDELLERVIGLPPPLMCDINRMPYYFTNNRNPVGPATYLTQVLSDRDIEKLLVPPPPRLI